MNMKKTLVLVPALVTMLFVSGNSRPEETSSQTMAAARELPTVAATKKFQSKKLVNNMLADTTLQKSSLAVLQSISDNTPLVYVDLSEKPKKPVIVKDTVATVEKTPNDIINPANVVPNKPYKSKIVYGGGRNRYGKYTKECAAHANGRLKRAGIYSFGHAYQIPCHFPSVINGYKKVKLPELSKISWEKRASAILNAHRQAAEYVKENLNINKLIPGRYYVVNMYYSTSPHMIEFYVAARKQGTGNYGTHVGVLYYDKKAEAWIVEHNIHGHVHYDALVSVLGGRSNPHKYGITSISKAS
jgi:hypothetical protein